MRMALRRRQWENRARDGRGPLPRRVPGAGRRGAGAGVLPRAGARRGCARPRRR